MRISLLAFFLFLGLIFSAEASAQDMNSTTSLVSPTVSGGAFPEGEAGISAYISTGQVVNLERLKAIFSNVEMVGDNYIVGVVKIPDWGGDVGVHLYADTDGWLVAYLKKDEPVSLIMQWGDSDVDNPALGVIKSNTLEDALYKAGDTAGVGIVASGIKYYDFEFPNANRLMIVAKVQATNGASINQIEIPESYMLFDSAYYHYTRYYYWDWGRQWTDSILKVDDSVISDAATSGSTAVRDGYGWWRSTDQYKGSLSPGTLHTIKISHDGADQGSSGVATVLIYRAA